MNGIHSTALRDPEWGVVQSKASPSGDVLAFDCREERTVSNSLFEDLKKLEEVLEEATMRKTDDRN